MIELEQLQHLVTFQECQTLSKAAKQLHISQPVLTRSMQKLEEELEVNLFNRTKNKIAFNETGLLAVSLAKRILDEKKKIKKQLVDFDRKLHTFAIGSCAPAPLSYLSRKFSQFYPQRTLLTEIKDMHILIKGLKEKDYTIIIMPYDIEDEQIESIPFMDEQLFFSLPLTHPLANKKSISLKEMDGEKMLVELSTLPSFTSDYVMKTEIMPQNRVIIPISDAQSHATFYCWYLRENESQLRTLLYHL